MWDCEAFNLQALLENYFGNNDDQASHTDYDFEMEEEIEEASVAATDSELAMGRLGAVGVDVNTRHNQPMIVTNGDISQEVEEAKLFR